jgi:hypothetical protein
LTEQSTIHKDEKLQTASRQDMTAESQTCNQMETVSLNDKFAEGQIDVAHTVLANYHKGLGAGYVASNGVIEWKE